MESSNAIEGFAALAQETRLETFRRLVVAGPEGLSAGALSETLKVSASAMSFHLKELTHAGLVTARRQGRNIIYATDYAGVRALIDFLLKDCCRDDPACCGPYANATK